jgi:hypothetical protein
MRILGVKLLRPALRVDFNGTEGLDALKALFGAGC